MMSDQFEQDEDDVKIEGDTFEKAAQSYLGSAGVRKLQAPKKTWFFQRGSGKNAYVFPCEEREAWDICNNRSEWKRRDFVLLGTSDGKKYNEVVKEASKMAEVLMPQIKAIQVQLKKYQQAEEKLIIDEVVDMDDLEDAANAANVAKVKRLHKIINGLRKQLSEKKDEYRKTVGEVVKRANEAELKVAVSNMKKNGAEWPRAANVITPSAKGNDRKKILRMMGHDSD